MRTPRYMTPLIVALSLYGIGCRGEHHETSSRLPPPSPTPDHFSAGEELFDRHCASCHGSAARGSVQGPSLIHRTYEPEHHADAAFHLAVEFGVRAHHWRFGDMPAIPGVNRSDVEKIVGYVRWLQEDAGGL